MPAPLTPEAARRFAETLPDAIRADARAELELILLWQTCSATAQRNFLIGITLTDPELFARVARIGDARRLICELTEGGQ